jgi:methyl-CpG-binding domain protein 4
MNHERLWEPPHLNSWDYPLIQEKYFPDRWKMLVCCLMLNLTSHRQVKPLIDGFFERWPNAEAAENADEGEMKEYLKSLGMYNKRAKTIIKMSKQFQTGFSRAKDLFGCGKYADDSDTIFYLGKWQDVTPTDGALKRYIRFMESLHS